MYTLDISVKRTALLLLSSTLLALGALFALNGSAAVNAQTNACGTLSQTYGVATADKTTSTGLADVSEGEYVAWSRLKHADETTFAYVLSVDGAGGSLCNDSVNGSSTVKDAWTWVKSDSTIDWTGGEMRLQMGGSQSGVGLDCVVLVPAGQSNAFASEYAASGDVDGCNPDDLTTPVVTGECGVADIDNSGKVDVGDLSKVLSSWNQTSAANNVVGDNEIDVADLSRLLSCWNEEV